MAGPAGLKAMRAMLEWRARPRSGTVRTCQLSARPFWPAVSRWQAASAPRTGRTEEAKAASHDRDLCAHLAALGTGPPATAQRVSSEVPVVGSHAPARRPRRPVSLPNASSAPRVVGRNGTSIGAKSGAGISFLGGILSCSVNGAPPPPPSRGRCDPAFLAQWCPSHKGAPPPGWGRRGGGAWMARYIPRPPHPFSPQIAPPGRFALRDGSKSRKGRGRVPWVGRMRGRP